MRRHARRPPAASLLRRGDKSVRWTGRATDGASERIFRQAGRLNLSVADDVPQGSDRNGAVRPEKVRSLLEGHELIQVQVSGAGRASTRAVLAAPLLVMMSAAHSKQRVMNSLNGASSIINVSNHVSVGPNACSLPPARSQRCVPIGAATHPASERRSPGTPRYRAEISIDCLWRDPARCF